MPCAVFEICPKKLVASRLLLGAKLTTVNFCIPYTGIEVKEKLQKMNPSHRPDEKEVAEMVDSISEWLHKQPHLPHIEDKELVTKFLVNCKFRLQKAKTKIENYYWARTNFPSVFQNRDPTSPEMRKTAEGIRIFPLSQPTKDGYKVVIFAMTCSPSDFNPAECVKRIFMVFDIMFCEDTSKLDYVFVLDFRGISLQHFLKLTPLGKVFIDIIENVYPGRLKGSYYIHAPAHAHRMAEFFKMLVKPKLRERIKVYKDIETFYEVIGDRDILPRDIGGKQPSISELNELYQKKLESYKSWFEEQEHIRSNEDLRPPNLKKSWLMGVEGSFKKLTVD